MASKAMEDFGYHDDRFEVAVSEGFHCPICLNVLRKPKMCQNNEHMFCEACITEHLRNSSTCPQCMDELTPDTLLRPPRSFMKCHSQLKIKCDHTGRGCQEYVELGNLSIHEKSCSFAPAKCSNKGCGIVVNKRDKLFHETDVCKYRKREDCCNCAKMKSTIDDLTNKLAEMMKCETENSESKPAQTDVNVGKRQQKTGPRTKILKAPPAYQHYQQDDRWEQNDPPDDLFDQYDPDDRWEQNDQPDDLFEQYDQQEDRWEQNDPPDDPVDQYDPEDRWEQNDQPDDLFEQYDQQEDRWEQNDQPDDPVDQYDPEDRCEQNGQPDDPVDQYDREDRCEQNDPADDLFDQYFREDRWEQNDPADDLFDRYDREDRWEQNDPVDDLFDQYDQQEDRWEQNDPADNFFNEYD
jgi:hypothetical protein